MSGEQRKRKCPTKKGQRNNTRDASTSTLDFPGPALAQSLATVENLSPSADGNSNNTSVFPNARTIAALYNRMNSHQNPAMNPRPVQSSESHRPTTVENRRQTTADNRPSTTSENRRPTVLDNRRPTASDNRRPITSENHRPTVSETRRTTASENRRPTTSENPQETLSENRRPLPSENRRPLPSENRRPMRMDVDNRGPTAFDVLRRLTNSENQRPSLFEEHRPNLFENRRPSVSENRRPAPSENQNFNAAHNPRQIPVQTPPSVRLPLQPRGQIPQMPRPAPVQTPASDYQALMNIFQGLSLLDRTVRKVRSNTGEFVTLLSSHVTVDAMGNFRRLEPAAIALYVVGGDETGKCCNCNREATTVCGKCRAVCYCSSFCLQRDWGNHEVHCNLEMLTFVQASAQQRLRI